MTPEPHKEFSPRQYAISLGSRIEYIVSHPDEYPETVEAVEEEIQSTLVRFHTQTTQSIREKIYKKLEECDSDHEEQLLNWLLFELKDLEAPVEGDGVWNTTGSTSKRTTSAVVETVAVSKTQK